MNFIENKYLPGFLISYLGLFYVTVQHNLTVYPSAQLHKKEGSQKKKRKILENIEFPSNLYEILTKGNKDIIAYIITYGPKSISSL